MKVTLSMDEELCRNAKVYAQKTGKTLSGLVKICLAKLLEEQKDEMGDDKLGWKEEG